jgi:hypothetical protein
MTPHLNAFLADSLMTDKLRRAAHQAEVARGRQVIDAEPQHDHVTVRRAAPRDAAAIRHLAELEGRRAPAEPVLVAEVDGTVLAARSLDERQAVAVPFRPTAQLVELLDLRSLHLRAELELADRPGRLRRAVRGLVPLR